MSSVNRCLSRKLTLVAGGMLAILPFNSVFAWDPVQDALTTMSKFNLNFRLRSESVDDATPGIKDADALTLRSRMSYESGAWEKLTAGLEMDNITALSSAQHYNDDTNGHTAYSKITDPDGSYVNQAWLNYAGVPGTQVKLGRQRITLDNERFFGAVGFRQHEQTFDALSLVNKSLPDTTLYYAKITNVNRIFGEDNPVGAGEHKNDSDILNVRYEGIPGLALVGYAYLIDDQAGNQGPYVEGTFSSNTYGMRASGKHSFGNPVLKYALEYATQKNAANNPKDYSADYSLAEIGYGVSRITATLGYEVLGADDHAKVIATGAPTTQGFQTPFGTLHKFQGWTDQFLGGGSGNLATGIKDSYVSVDGLLYGLNYSVNYHDYKACNTTATVDHLGSEWGASLEKKWGNYSVSTAYGRYLADDSVNLATKIFDKSKLWVTMQAAF